MRAAIVLALSLLVLSGCTRSNPDEIWIYTSLYKDTIADIEPKLQKAFPDIEFRFFQAGSEEIAAKVNAEMMAGGTKADILISSDRFWYEELSDHNQLHPYNTSRVHEMPEELRHSKGFYNTLSIPVMVLAYNKEVFRQEQAPKTFKELVGPEWHGKFTTGSPLASGTNFTTVAFLSKAYGWEFFKKLQLNNTISEGGNSAVLRRVRSKERPVGWVLLENILRFQGKDSKIATVFPKDGVVIHNNVLAITRKKASREKAEKVAAWLFGEQGQAAMVRSFMYSPFPDGPTPKGAPPLKDLNRSSFSWTQDFVRSVVRDRFEIKEKFAEIMFH